MIVRFSLLRGVCQTPAYVAHELGYFRDEGLETELGIEPTAWMVPGRLAAGESQFAVIPWTRTATASNRDLDLLLVSGSGVEEAALVVREGLDVSEVQRVTVPLRGGMKDLTAMALVDSLEWDGQEIQRQPSGDGAIIALFGQGCDAASMVEPYATMMEDLAVGRIVRRTGDIWPGAPGCSLTTTQTFRDQEESVVEAAVRAFVRGVDSVREDPSQAAEIASRYIGVNERFIDHALQRNRPDANAIRNQEAMEAVLSLMVRLGYIDSVPSGFSDLSFLDRTAASV